MQGHVFRLYSRGRRLGAPVGPFVGDLRLEKRNDGTGNVIAQVVGMDDWRLPELHYAKVEAISGGGLILRGTEYIPRRSNNKAGADRHPQVWWALTEQRAIDLVRLRQLKAGVREAQEELAEIEEDHLPDEDWHPAALQEVERLKAVIEERRRAAGELGQALGVDGNSGPRTR